MLASHVSCPGLVSVHLNAAPGSAPQMSKPSETSRMILLLFKKFFKEKKRTQNTICVWCVCTCMSYFCKQVEQCVRMYPERVSPKEVGLNFFSV